MEWHRNTAGSGPQTATEDASRGAPGDLPAMRSPRFGNRVAGARGGHETGNGMHRPRTPPRARNKLATNGGLRNLCNVAQTGRVTRDTFRKLVKGQATSGVWAWCSPSFTQEDDMYPADIQDLIDAATSGLTDTYDAAAAIAAVDAKIAATWPDPDPNIMLGEPVG